MNSRPKTNKTNEVHINKVPVYNTRMIKNCLMLWTPGLLKFCASVLRSVWAFQGKGAPSSPVIETNMMQHNTWKGAPSRRQKTVEAWVVNPTSHHFQDLSRSSPMQQIISYAGNIQLSTPVHPNIGGKPSEVIKHLGHVWLAAQPWPITSHLEVHLNSTPHLVAFESLLRVHEYTHCCFHLRMHHFDSYLAVQRCPKIILVLGCLLLGNVLFQNVDRLFFVHLHACTYWVAVDSQKPETVEHSSNFINPWSQLLRLYSWRAPSQRRCSRAPSLTSPRALE